MSNGDVLLGQRYDEENDVIEPFEQQMMDRPDAEALVGVTARTELIPNDVASTLRRTYTTVAPYDLYKAVYISSVDFRLPPRLNGFDVHWETANGAGDYDDGGGGFASGNQGSLSLSFQGSGQGSASVIPDIIPDIEEFWTQDFPCTQIVVLLPYPVTQAQLLAKLNWALGSPVLAWPRFRPKSHRITLYGQKVSVSARATAQAHTSFDLVDDTLSKTESEGAGQSVDISNVIRTLTIPPTIHGQLSIVATAPTIPASATATAVVDGYGGFPSASATRSVEVNATGSIYPLTFNATNPATVPTSGYYLHSSIIRHYKRGYLRFICNVVDFALL